MVSQNCKVKLIQKAIERLRWQHVEVLKKLSSNQHRDGEEIDKFAT